MWLSFWAVLVFLSLSSLIVFLLDAVIQSAARRDRERCS